MDAGYILIYIYMGIHWLGYMERLRLKPFLSPFSDNRTLSPWFEVWYTGIPEMVIQHGWEQGCRTHPFFSGLNAKS